MGSWNLLKCMVTFLVFALNNIRDLVRVRHSIPLSTKTC